MPLPIAWIGSPHLNKGRGGYRPEAIVVHIMEGTLSGTDAWFNDPTSKVSSHYGIGRNGEVHQYVHEADTAWHAGRRYQPSWKLIRPGVNPNLYTLGIEHEGDGETPWSEAMLASSTELIRDLCNRWAIPVDRDHIIGHREIYALKTCPGRAVDLDALVERVRARTLAAEGHALVVESGTVRARTGLNIRRGAPTALAPILRTVAAGTPLSYTAWTSAGQAVNANAHWYRDPNGDFFWAGGTDHPIPALVAAGG
jgi:hypothetical protein